MRGPCSTLSWDISAGSGLDLQEALRLPGLKDAQITLIVKGTISLLDGILIDGCQRSTVTLLALGKITVTEVEALESQECRLFIHSQASSVRVRSLSLNQFEQGPLTLSVEAPGGIFIQRPSRTWLPEYGPPTPRTENYWHQYSLLAIFRKPHPT